MRDESFTPPFTSTEKLAVAEAIDIYGIENLEDVTEHITMVFEHVRPCKWQAIYKEILKEYPKDIYSSVLDYCMDKRVEMARELLHEKINLRNRLLRGEDVPFEPVSEVVWDECEPLGLSLGDAPDLDETSFESTDLLYDIDPIVLSNYLDYMAKEMGQPQQQEEENHPIPEVKKKPAPTKPPAEPVAPKEKRRYYYRMSDEDREIDDFIDKLDEDNYASKRKKIVPPNILRGKYPFCKHTINTKDNTNTAEELLPMPDQVGGPSSLRDRYETIMDKVNGSRKFIKDRTLWKEELFAIVEYFSKIIEGKFEGIRAKLVTDTMANIILHILLILQNEINSSKNEQHITMCAKFKKNIVSFCDFYKK